MTSKRKKKAPAQRLQRVARLRIQDFRGIETLDLEPGAVTLAEGGTGAGKTSILEALQVALSNAGQHPRLVREGADYAVILVELDDGTEVKRTLSTGKDTGSVTVTDPDGHSVRAPQAYLDGLVDALAFNPVEFLSMESKEQARLLLEALPLEPLTEGDLHDLIGDVDFAAEGWSTMHPLVTLRGLEREVFDERTLLNRDAKEATIAAKDLCDGIPADFDAEAWADVDSTSLSEELSAANHAQAEYQRLASDLAEAEERADQLRERLKAAIVTRSHLVTEIESLGEHPDPEPLRRRMADYDQSRRHLQALEDAQAKKEAAEEWEQLSVTLTEALGRIRSKPAELLRVADLPVEGLSLADDGTILIDDRPIASLSDGEKVTLALTLAQERVGTLGLLLVDGLEKLDADLQEELLDQAAVGPYQWLLTRVTAGELEVHIL